MSLSFGPPNPDAKLPETEIEQLLLMFRDMRASGSWDAATMDRVIENTVSLASPLKANGEAEKLKPCPFCGDMAELKPGYPLTIVACQECGGRVMRPTEDGAVEAWNLRYPHKTPEEK